MRRLSVLLPLLLITAPAWAQDCASLAARFNAAADGGREAEAEAVVTAIAAEPGCSATQTAAQRRLAAMRLATLQPALARNALAPQEEQRLVQAEMPQVLWQASATLGEWRLRQRRFAEAVGAFDRAIEIVRSESLTPVAPPAAAIEDLLARAGQARLLAAGSAPGSAARFVPATRDKRDGRLGGLYAPSVRGIIPKAIPVPITFEYAKADFTDVGQQAARELLAAIREQQPERITVIGHTDPRGGAAYNRKLSEDRAEAVATFLKANGVMVPIDVVGKGADEPLKVADPEGLTQDDLFALNRRVEWRRN